MKCKSCSKEVEALFKYLAYYANGKPVYWSKCESCIKDMWARFKKELCAEIKDKLNN